MWFAGLCCALGVVFAGCDGSPTLLHLPDSGEMPEGVARSESASAAPEGSSAAAPSGSQGGPSTERSSETPAMTSAAPAPSARQDAARKDGAPSGSGSSVAADSAGQGASPPDSSAGGGKAPDGEDGEPAGGSNPDPPASPDGSEPEPPADDAGVGEPSPPADEDASGPDGAGSPPDVAGEVPGSEAPQQESPRTEPPEDETPTEPPGAEPPGDDGPDAEPPADDASGAEPPADGAPGAEPPGDDGPGAEPPADDGPDAEPPGSDTGTDHVAPGSPEIPSGLGSFHLTVIGSSTAAGIGASRGDLGWVSLLDAALTAKVSTTFSSSNLARGGYTASDLLPGSTSPGSIDDAIAEKPDLIVVALAGSNDLGPGVTTETFIAALITLRATARAAGIPTFFMGTLPKNFNQTDRETLLEWDRAMAREFSLCWIPGPSQPYAPCFMDVFVALADASLGLAPALDSGDGQHPNDAGHALLFSGVAPIVSGYVCSKTLCR